MLICLKGQFVKAAIQRAQRQQSRSDAKMRSAQWTLRMWLLSRQHRTAALIEPTQQWCAKLAAQLLRCSGILLGRESPGVWAYLAPS